MQLLALGTINNHVRGNVRRINIAHQIRIGKLYTEFFGELVASTCNKYDMKKDAWLCKGFIVLVKRKLGRTTKSKNKKFQLLLRMLKEPCRDS